MFCDSSDSKSCVIASCVLLDLRVTRTIEESIQILRKARSPDCITEKHVPILQKFELSFYKRLPQSFITKCEETILTSTEHEIDEKAESKDFCEDLERELQTFYKLNLLEQHRDALWKHTQRIMKLLSFASETIQFLAAQSLRQLVIHSKSQE